MFENKLKTEIDMRNECEKSRTKIVERNSFLEVLTDFPII